MLELCEAVTLLLIEGQLLLVLLLHKEDVLERLVNTEADTVIVAVTLVQEVIENMG